MNANKKKTKNQCISFPIEIHQKIVEKTSNEVAGFSRFVVTAVKEKFSRLEDNTSHSSNKRNKEVCAQ